MGGIGLVSVSFRNLTPMQILKAMNKAGLSVIEWGSDIHAPASDIKRLNEIKELQKEHSIACCSYGTYFRLGETPMAELEDYINAAKILEADVLRLWCGNKSGDDMTSYERKKLVSECKAAAKIAENSGVTLCMECHKKTFTENCEDAVFLMNEINSPNFRMYWQPFQWQSTEENIINARKISPYAVNIHVFNWHGADKLPLADATEDWKKYLKEFPYSCNLLLEFMPNGTIEELSTEAESLKNIAGGRL